ncbi:MAG: helix-turn-helix domain-containing protein [Halanaeroarchaeum sp.]
MTTRPRSAEPANSRDLQLWVELLVVAPSDTSCPLTDLEDRIDSTERDHYAGVCTIDVELQSAGRSPSGKRRLTHDMDEACLCPVFLQHGCSPRIVSSRGREGIVSTTLPDRDTLRDLVADIRSAGGTASVRKLTTVGPETDADAIRTFEIDELTDRERVVMETAVSRGYYDRPRRVTLADLAAEFDVTKQTLSTCLNSAEAKMARSIMGSP